MKPVIDVIHLSREEIVRTDETSTVGTTYIGKTAAWLTPVTTRTGVDCRWIFAVDSNGRMLKPLDQLTGLYFEKPQVWDDRLTYTYA